MSGNIVARRYAKALFAVAAKKGEKDQQSFGAELAAVVQVLQGSPALSKVFRNPVFGVEEKKAILGKLLVKLNPSPTVKNFLSLLADKNRLSYLPEIQDYYNQLLDEASGVLRGQLVTAVDVAAKKKDDLKKKLEKQTGKKLVLDFTVDPKILGGVVLKVGDRVMDASLRAQLQILKENIKRGE